MAKNIKVLDDFIKAYEKQKKAVECLEAAKKNVIKYLKNISLLNTIYKEKLFILCEKKTFTYSSIVDEMSDALQKQKKIEELKGEAKIKNTTEYIRLTEKPNKKKEGNK